MKSKLTQEEKELLDLFETNQLKSVVNPAGEIKKAREAAKEHLKKTARVNIRLSQFDLDQIKRIAANEGLPYQTLISSVLHKFVRNA